MINFRYHIVSLTAVFLALAVGLAMGTTFLNKAAVDQLKHDIQRAEDRIDRTKADNQDLQDEIGRYEDADQALIDDGMSQLLADQLTDVPVLVIESDGADSDSLDNLKEALGDAGAELRGTLVIADPLRSDGGHDDDLATAVDRAEGTDRSTLQTDVQEQFAQVLKTVADRRATSKAEQPPLITRLLDAGFLRFDAPDDAHDESTVLAGGGYRYVFVSGADPKVPDTDFLLPVLSDLAADGGAPAVLASAATGGDAEANRTLVVGPVRKDKALAATVSTVDDLEHFSGLVATVLAVRDLEDGIRGHYGIGDKADSPIPKGS